MWQLPIFTPCLVCTACSTSNILSLENGSASHPRAACFYGWCPWLSSSSPSWLGSRCSGPGYMACSENTRRRCGLDIEVWILISDVLSRFLCSCSSSMLYTKHTWKLCQDSFGRLVVPLYLPWFRQGGPPRRSNMCLATWAQNQVCTPCSCLCVSNEVSATG